MAEDQNMSENQDVLSDIKNALEPAELSEMQGFVADMLRRAPAKVREDRGMDTLIDIQTIAKRKIEDYALAISRKQREKRNLYDFSGTNALSLVTKDVDGQDIEERDEQLRVEIHNLVTKWELAKQSYNERFGQIYEINPRFVY